jgi:nucleotide-binding universal stress UspA family protein
MDSEVVLLHVLKHPDVWERSAARILKAKQLLEDLRTRSPQRIRLVLRTGDVAEKILECAEMEEIDLIMMPVRRRGFVSSLVRTSIFEKVLRQSRCAIWASAGPCAASRKSVRRIVCAVDLGEDSGRVLDGAQELHRTLNGGLTVLHAVPEMGHDILYLAALHDLPVTLSAGNAYQEVERRQSLAGVTGKIRVAEAQLESAVQRTSKDHDLLVIGPGRGAGQWRQLGDNVLRIVHAAGCPVMVLPKHRPIREEDAISASQMAA